jgi:membrane-associated protein
MHGAMGAHGQNTIETCADPEGRLAAVRRTPVSWALMTSTTLALMPDFLDPVKLLGYFGTWALVGLLVVIFVESGVLFPVLPGDTLLFVAGMLAAGTAAAAKTSDVQANFQLWQLLVFIPVAAILGGQAGYFIGRFIGVEMFKPNARFLKQRYLDEAHAFFEQRGPFAIVLARFVPIVRTLAPITAGAARMRYATFTIFNIIGAVVWGVGLVLLGYGLGQFEVIQKLLEPIFILIAVISVLPMVFEWRKRKRAARNAGGGPDAAQIEDPA